MSSGIVRIEAGLFSYTGDTKNYLILFEPAVE